MYFLELQKSEFIVVTTESNRALYNVFTLKPHFLKDVQPYFAWVGVNKELYCVCECVVAEGKMQLQQHALADLAAALLSHSSLCLSFPDLSPIIPSTALA